jgi:acetylornithine deacetylase/succinyl-diaminopimelate desuccinylase-like protein
MDQAAELLADWCRAAAGPGMSVEIVRLEGRTPVVLVEVPGHNDDTVLLYGHLDKQPEFDGWSDGL